MNIGDRRKQWMEGEISNSEYLNFLLVELSEIANSVQKAEEQNIPSILK